jgi:hypothetical protein
MKKQILINKPRGLYGKLLVRLTEINKQDRFIEWKIVYEKLGRGFSIKKEEVRETMCFLRDVGFCDVSCKGVRLNFEVIE